MSRHKHLDSTLIDAVGTKIVRDAFSLSPQGLWAWRQRGVPLAKRIAFARLCADNMVPTPPGFFEEFKKLGIPVPESFAA